MAVAYPENYQGGFSENYCLIQGKEFALLSWSTIDFGLLS